MLMEGRPVRLAGQDSRRGTFVFFFSSRRRHTSYIGDWSSDVCSSDLIGSQLQGTGTDHYNCEPIALAIQGQLDARSEERRVGKDPTEWTTVPDYPEKVGGTTRTAVTAEVMKRIADAYVTPPEDFTVHP